MIRRALMLVLLLSFSGTAVAVSVTASPNNCQQISGGGRDWSRASRAETSNGSYATATSLLSLAGTTDYLQCTGYDFSAVPADAVINGITVNVERKTSSLLSLGTTQDAAMRLVKGGGIGSADRSTSTAYTTSDVSEAHGGATDLWGDNWTVADIQSADFGAAFKASLPAILGVVTTVSVDYISITVDYTVPPFECTQPANTPAGLSLTCVCDTFGRTSLNPSTIFGANWIASKSDGTSVVPYINQTTGYLRLTENTAANAKAATVPGIFPAAGNYISVEFQHFAYDGSGADGMAVILSDYTTPAVPGAFGGSLGYAQKSNPGSDCTTAGGCPGFAGGWIGVALDEYGNYQNPTEGRLGGPGFIRDSVGVRGSGAGMEGYRWLSGTGSLDPAVDNPGSASPAPGHYYQVIVDARNEPTSTTVTVNRDTGGTGNNYASLFNLANVYTAALAQGFAQDAVPDYWQVSFTGSTGASTNIHEIGKLRICAQTILPPSGGAATNFAAIDDAYGMPPVASQYYQTGHIYTKLVGVPFKLNVAALNSTGISTYYAATGNKTVTLKLVDNSDGACNSGCTAACTGKTAVASQTLIFADSNKGQKQSANFTLNSAYKNLVAVISGLSATDGSSVTDCSTDAFAVRPLGIASVASIETPSGVTPTNAATNSGTGGTPVFKAGGDPFALTATSIGVAGFPSGYTGVLKINNAAVQAVSPAVVAGAVTGTFPAAASGTPSSIATGAAFTYGEVGAFRFLGYDPAADIASPRGVFDGVATATECNGMTAAQCDTLKGATWTGVDSISTKADCVSDSYANVKDASGKYGCNFGLVTNAGPFGRFVPHHFTLSAPTLANRSDIAGGGGSTFTYMGETMAAAFTLTAQNGTGGTTKNYTGNLAKLTLTNPSVFGFGALDSAAVKTPLTARLNASASAGTWPSDPGPGYANNGIASVTATLALTRAAVPDGPYENLDIGAMPTDSDGVTLQLDVLPAGQKRDMDDNGSDDHQLIGSTRARFGVLRLGNAYGTEALLLRVPLEAQYWNGTVFQTNYDDSHTPLAAGNFKRDNYQKNLQNGETALTVGGGGTLNQGRMNLSLSAPGVGNNGSVDLCIDLDDPAAVIDAACAATGANLPYLQGAWRGAAYSFDPKSRATFGVYKSSSGMIYLRENY